MNDAQQKPRRAGFWNRITVAQRIFLLVLVPLLLLFLIGSGSIFALNQNQQAIREIRDRVVAIDMGNNLLNGIQSEFEILLHEVSSGRRTWAEGLEHLTRLKTLLEQDIFPRYRAAKAGRDNEQREQDFRQLLTVLDQGIKRLQAEDRSALALYLLNDLEADYGPVRDHFASGVQEDIQQVYQTFDVASLEARNFLIEAFVLIVAGMMLVALLGYLIYRSISSQVTHLTGTIRDIAAGDLNARVQLAGHNELVELGDAFDGMVEERIATQKKINADHQRLNNSVFALLEAVADLSEKNLTVRATVTEDATGPLADAINQLAEDTGDVLGEVRTIALSVESAANDVNQHALSVRELAALERTEAQETLDQMGVILRRLDSIAASARQADTMAASTGASLREAQQSV
nr:methyl-accepting chemotaxis protein [Thiolinea sp.]